MITMNLEPDTTVRSAPQAATSVQSASIFRKRGASWEQHRASSRNWLAFGLLLAAWNAVDDDAAGVQRRPAALRGYSSVSVRAVQRATP